MKYIILLLTTVLNFGLLVAQDTTKVLFIGNSITYFNNMPQTFEDIANSLGDTTEMTMYAPGGTGFVHHVTDPNVFSYFRQGGWDFIVLQPGSNESPGYSYPIEETLSRARILVDSIYKYNSCTKVLFYEISYGVWGNSAANLVTYNNTMDLIRANLEYLSDSTESFFAPVGEAFRASWNNDQNDMLWGGYGDIHPNAKGSYIAACVFYSSIFQKPSLGSHILGTLSEPEALSVQLLADSITLNNLPDWRINTYFQLTDFNYSINSDTVYFNNMSQNFDSVLWDFGDGFFSTEINPFHLYSSSGNYNVNLITYLHGCAKSVSDNIIFTVSEILEIASENNFIIYPNPTNNFLNIKLKNKEDNYIFEIYNNTGQLILETDRLIIDVSEYLNGIYFLKIINNRTSGIKVIKWIKN